MPEPLLLLREGEVAALLAGQEEQILQVVAEAYRRHGRGESSLPHSSFLRFPGDERNRIIALPAYLGGDRAVAGMKWIASFPGNLDRGIPRASAVIVLNSAETGRPTAILEGAVISAERTSASAALAARTLGSAATTDTVGLIGTGLINWNVCRFLLRIFPAIRRLVLHDLDARRAEAFATRLAGSGAAVEVEIADRVEEVLARCHLTGFATTAARPYVTDVSACPDGATILHVSLRDLSPEVMLAADNVVDDVDHVLRAATSLDLARRQTGDASFIRCTLADVLEGVAPPKRDADALTVFSPFGLGILDLAVASWVVERAREQGVGTPIPDFLSA